MNLALIGNCAFQALIDDHAAVRWLCWPRFDSSFVFGDLLDEERGGAFTIAPREQSFNTDQDYLPNTNILRTVFSTASASFEVIDFAPRFRQYERFFKPTMLVRRVRPLSGCPSVRVACRPVYDYGRAALTPLTASNHIYWNVPGSELRLTTNLPLSYVLESRPVVLEHDVYLVLTWGRPLEAPLAETVEAFLQHTRDYWRAWTKHGVLTENYQDEVIRSALTLKLHQFEDTGAITAATTTSLPEHPGSGRNWDYRFCWLRDACFTLGALRRLGQFEELEEFITYLINIAESSPDQLQPVYGISGEPELSELVLEHLRGYQGHGPVRVGNAAYSQSQHDVYGEMIAAIAPVFVDLRFRDLAGAHSTALLRRLLARVGDTLELPDAGLWEKRDRPRLHTFTLLMHWAGARAACRIGERIGDRQLAEQGRTLMMRASRIIEERCWREDLGHYSDAVDTDHADASLLLMVNLGYLPPDHPRALRHVTNLGERLGASNGLLHRYTHDDGIGATSSAFTVCGFWQAEALARLGLRDESEGLFEKLIAHGNHVGLLSEDIDPTTGSQWGNFPQTYSHVGMINAAFAISPAVGTIL
jgi:GH15 family glucan-1,4-alpha-glucosidase